MTRKVRACGCERRLSISARRKPGAFAYAPPPGAVPVLHADDRLVLIDKPAGLLSVPGKGAGLADCAEARLRTQFPDALLVHRLDMDTSGVMVFARDRAAQRHLGLQFERRHVTKTYVARVAGVLKEEAGEIDLPLIADWPNRPLQKVCHETGRPALTRWRVLEREPGGTTRLLLMPLTGRSHQLRLHLAAIGHAILGDRFYGGAPAPRLMLHATRLEFHHPEGGTRQSFDSTCPF